MNAHYKMGAFILAVGGGIVYYGSKIMVIGVQEIYKGREQDKTDKEFETIVEKNFKSQ